MAGIHRPRLIATAAAAAAAVAVLAPTPGLAGARVWLSTGGAPTGGAPILPGGLAPTRPPRPAKVPSPPSAHARGRWLAGVEVTQYWPALESWFVGRLVKAPGLPGLHRIDWLYSAAGVSMEGEGIGSDGRVYHLDAPGDGGWVTAAGTVTTAASNWSQGAPFWRAGDFWRNRAGAVTFPLSAGGWSAGTGRRYVPLPGVSFAAGASLPLRFDRSLAVDPRLIPLGSRVYVPAYRHDGFGGWFIAQDTGGAIEGRHVDVYRAPPASPSDPGQTLTAQRIFVIPARR